MLHGHKLCAFTTETAHGTNKDLESAGGVTHQQDEADDSGNHKYREHKTSVAVFIRKGPKEWTHDASDQGEIPGADRSLEAAEPKFLPE